MHYTSYKMDENTCQYCGKKYKKNGFIKNHIQNVHRDILLLEEQQKRERNDKREKEYQEGVNLLISSFNEKEDYLHDLILELKNTVDNLQDEVNRLTNKNSDNFY